VFNLDPGKLLIIGVVAILVLGPDKVPRVARDVGGAWRSFSQFRQRMEAEVRSTIPDLPSSEHLTRLARSPAALFEHLGSMDASTRVVPPTSPETSTRVVPAPDPTVLGDAGLN
jgi:TatA/E family protein of Tat protein translocase